MTTSFTSIPTLDLSQASNPTTLPHLLTTLRHALVDIGFLYITNHGVPSSTIADLVAALPQLFRLDAAAKRAVALENSPHFLGYSGVGSETTGGAADRREQFEFATELLDTWKEGEPLYERLRGPNQVRPFVCLCVFENSLTPYSLLLAPPPLFFFFCMLVQKMNEWNKLGFMRGDFITINKLV